jgi:AraC-like DNA-binding protein
LDNTDQKESVRYTRSQALPNVELLEVRGSAVHWQVFHERYAICSNDLVAAEIRYRNETNQVCDRSTLIFEPGETHQTRRVVRPQDFQVLFLTPEILHRYSEEMEIPCHPHFRPEPNKYEQVYLSCKLLHEAILDDAAEIEQQSRLAECVGMLLTNHTERRALARLDPGKQGLLRARDYVHDQHPHSVTLDEMASIAGLSRFYFLKAFTAYYGLTPHAYQIHLRIERSLPLLRHGMSLTQVTETMGFFDQSHFIRYFKRIMGVTPGQYQGRL